MGVRIVNWLKVTLHVTSSAREKNGPVEFKLYNTRIAIATQFIDGNRHK